MASGECLVGEKDHRRRVQRMGQTSGCGCVEGKEKKENEEKIG